jgi:hypothetical protein
LAEGVSSQRRSGASSGGSAGTDRLRAVLGDDPPASVAALDPKVVDQLAAVVEAAKARQSVSLLEAFDATLKHVPFPARKLVKKVLLG